jgi:hypothetical protein
MPKISRWPPASGGKKRIGRPPSTNAANWSASKPSGISACHRISDDRPKSTSSARGAGTTSAVYVMAGSSGAVAAIRSASPAGAFSATIVVKCTGGSAKTK